MFDFSWGKFIQNKRCVEFKIKGSLSDMKIKILLSSFLFMFFLLPLAEACKVTTVEGGGNPKLKK